MFNDQDKERFKRQLDIPQFGVEIQKKLKESRVAVLGLGGVGGTAALYLAAAGAGNLLLADRDVVEISNLNRQILYTEADLGLSKVEVAAERLKALNNNIHIEAIRNDIDESSLLPLLGGCDFVLDCLDTNYIRLAVNRACVKLGLPASHAFAQDFSGELITILPGESACLACVLDESFPEPEDVPVLGVATGMVGVGMAAAAVRYLTGLGDVAAGYRLIYDLAFPQTIKIPLPRHPSCPVCGRN